jgi:hypothetical protein
MPHPKTRAISHPGSVPTQPAANGKQRPLDPRGDAFEVRWAEMDELAKQLNAVWPEGVSAVEAIQDVRR